MSARTTRHHGNSQLVASDEASTGLKHLPPTDQGYAERFDGGPKQAIDEFLAERCEFEVDRRYCDFVGRNVTYNVDGFLRRV